ncbi:MAG: hypothetical protein IT291_01115 [Deltaproteobacteria bacterium]|nr:hypothetical protein [Deltaproteobacteria bacterium]
MMFKYFHNEKGATLLEYLLVASLIMLACVIGVAAVGGEASKLLSNPELKEAIDTD